MIRFPLALLPFVCALAACGGASTPASSSASDTTLSPQTVAAAAAPEATPIPASAQAAASSPPTAAGGCEPSDFREQILVRVNAARANSRMCGDAYYASAPPLAWNDKLSAAAAAHAGDMAERNYFSHTSLDGRTFDQRIAATGYEWSTVGENIAAGQTSIAEVMEAWLNSPGHCANLMNGNYTEVGASCVKSASSTYKQYWAMEFGRPQ